MSKLDELNALEEAEAEEAAGMSIFVLEVKGAPRTRLLGALAWVHKKRTEPGLTFEEFMTSNKTRDIFAYLFDDEDEDEAAAKEDGEPFPGDGAGDVAEDDSAGAGRGEGEAEGAVRAEDGDRAE